MRPFLPYSDDDRSHLLTAFMVGKSDGEDYGKLQVYEMPPGDFPRGPALVQGDIQRDPDVSELETLLGSRSQGSQVDYGSLTAIPIDGGLIYVRPLDGKSVVEGKRVSVRVDVGCDSIMKKKK